MPFLSYKTKNLTINHEVFYATKKFRVQPFNTKTQYLVTRKHKLILIKNTGMYQN